MLPDLIGALESLADGKTLSVTAKTLFPLGVDLPEARPAANPVLEGGADRGIRYWASTVASASRSSVSSSTVGSEPDSRHAEEVLSGRGNPSSIGSR